MTPLQQAYGNLRDGLNKKQSEKALKAIADNLPKTVYIAKKIVSQEIQDLREREIKNSMFPEVGQSVFSSENTQIFRKTENYFYANHKRRLREAYNKEGKSGVLKYISWVNENNKAVNNAHQNTKTMLGVSSIIKERIKPIFE